MGDRAKTQVAPLTEREAEMAEALDKALDAMSVLSEEATPGQIAYAESVAALIRTLLARIEGER